MEAARTTRSNWFRAAFYKMAGFVPPSLVRGLSRARATYPWVKRCLAWLPDILRSQEGIIRHGEAKGLRFNSGQSNVGFLLGSADPRLQSIFKLLVNPGAVVYDIGANVGFFTVLAAKLTGPAGRVLAFEPLKENSNVLEHNVQLNNFTHVTVRDFAVADRDGTAEFLLSGNATFGGLANSTERVENQVGKTDVRVSRLDSVVHHDSLPLPRIIKIDVEGGEAAVLDGAAETIQKARPILIIELHGTNAVISGKLKALGYFPVVPGGTAAITEAHWNAQVVAFPAPCPELTELQNSRWGS